MHNISHKDFGCIMNMLEAIEKIERYSGKFDNADEFYNNTISFDATMMNFIVVGEMVEKLSQKFINQTEKKINWTNIKGFRNILAHNYFGIDAEEVWQIINGSLQHLKKELEHQVK